MNHVPFVHAPAETLCEAFVLRGEKRSVLLRIVEQRVNLMLGDNSHRRVSSQTNTAYLPDQFSRMQRANAFVCGLFSHIPQLEPASAIISCPYLGAKRW